MAHLVSINHTVVEGEEYLPHCLVEENDGDDGEGPDDQGVLRDVEVDVLVGAHAGLVAG